MKFRGWREDKIRLVTGVDKEYSLHWGYTQFTVTTCGMMWQWLTLSDGQDVRKVLWDNWAFLLDELAGSPGDEWAR